MYALMSEEVTAEKIKTKDQISEMLDSIGYNKWKKASVLSKIKGNGVIWTTESTHWIFIYQAGNLVCGVDKKRP